MWRYNRNELTCMLQIGKADRMRFQLDGYELETNFVVVDDVHGLEDFLLGKSIELTRCSDLHEDSCCASSS